MPALSNDDSLLSSHLSGRLIRKPAGGGPDGVAERKPEVENATSALVEGVKVRTELESLAVGRLRATSMVKGFADAIVVLLVA